MIVRSAVYSTTILSPCITSKDVPQRKRASTESEGDSAEEKMSESGASDISSMTSRSSQSSAPAPAPGLVGLYLQISNTEMKGQE